MRIIIIISELKGIRKWWACDCFEFKNCELRVKRKPENSLDGNRNHRLHRCNIKPDDDIHCENK